jgi:hypothetical protein
MKKIFVALLAILLVVIAGCNMPTEATTQSPDAAYTAAAQTVQAELTKLAPPPTPLATPTAVIPPTPIPIPTNTSAPLPTGIPVPCNRASYDPATIDVTFPDGATVTAGANFTKTWRLTNAGTCTWTSGYQLVFHQGDALGVPVGYAQSLTSGSVPPGASVDISVNLTAPTTVKDYKGYWRLREPGGEYFGLNNSGGDFWVSITVAVSGNSVTLTPVAAESGTVNSNGAITTAEYTAGDSATNIGRQLFMSYNISGIPATATIKEAKLDLTGYTLTGNPFTTLSGCLQSYPVTTTYTVLAAGLYLFGAPPTAPDHDWCNTTSLATVVADNDFKTDVQNKLAAGRVQFRFQFTSLTDGNSTADAITFSTIKLIVTYTTP